MKTKIIILLIASILVPARLHSQDSESGPVKDGSIRGRVFDSETMTPLEFVNVYLDGTVIGTATSEGGRFKISHIRPGQYTLIVSHMGYERYREENLVVRSGVQMNRSISLNPTKIEGEEVVITAGLREQTVRMAPASVSVIRAEDIDSRPVDTFDQVLENGSGISVYRSAGVSVQSLSIRGSSDVAGGGVGNRVLLMIDGRPALTPDAGGAFWSLVPVNLIERVEVVKGAFSSLYGSTAMGGVINVITRRPAYKSLTRVDLTLGIFEKPSPAMRHTDKTAYRKQIEVNHSGSRGRLSYLINANRKESDGHAEATSYEFHDLFGKLIYSRNQSRSLELTIGGGLARNDYPHSWLSNVQPLKVRSKYKDDRQEKRHASIDIHYWAVPNASIKYDSRFYYYLNAATSYFNENDPLQSIPGNEPFGATTDIDGKKFGNVTQLDILHRNHYVVAGLDLQLDHVRSSPDSVMYGNHQVNNAAVYVQDEITFNSKWTVTMGLRYDWNHLVDGSTFSLYSPKLATVFLPSPNVSVRLLFGQAFRAPTIAERFFRKEIAGGTLFKPNPSLSPEKMDLSLESGLKWQLSKYVDLDFALFRYHYRNMIYWIDISEEEGVDFPYFQVRNLNKALMQGLEFTFGLKWKKHLRSSASYIYLDSQDQSADREDDLLAYRPRHSFTFSTNYQWKRYSLNLSGIYRSEIQEVFLYPRERPEPFFVMDMKIDTRLSNNLSISCGVKNIFDVQYEELARYRAPGRNWSFGTVIRLQ